VSRTKVFAFAETLSTVYEGELEVFLKERGVSVLKEGTPTMYPIPSKK